MRGVLAMFFQGKKKRIYLDYASATPVRPEVVQAMEPFWNGDFGNAGAIHQEGVRARNAVERARETLAAILHIRPEGVIFTGSGTESNNIVLFGVIAARLQEGIAYEDMEIVTTAIEHASILEVLKRVQEWGVRVVFVATDEQGRIDAQLLRESVTRNTILFTCAYANSEVGTVQHLSKLARIIKAREKEFGTHIYVHTDAAQAPLWLSCEMDKLSVDIMTLDAGKCYGPKGVGVVAFRHGVALAPHLFGGAQEGGLRPGTENTALIVGAVEALSRAQARYKDRSEKISKLSNNFIEQLECIDGIELNGSREDRIANNINISIPGIDSEFAVITLDEKGIACSTKSACGGAKGDGSAVVRTLTSSKEKALSTIRFSLGEDTTQDELDLTLQTLKNHVDAMRLFAKSAA